MNRRKGQLAGWGLALGGALFFIGGSMHPHEDPPGITLKEHLQILFDNPNWYPAHALLLAGMALMAVGLVSLTAGGGPALPPRVRAVGRVAGLVTAVGAADMLLHLVVATEAGRLAAGQPTPLIDVHVILESLSVPAFGLAIAALALAGPSTGVLGGRVAAAPGVIGGIGYAFAGGTFLFTDFFEPLFPTAAGIGIWAVVAGVALLLLPAPSPRAQRERWTPSVTTP